MCHKTGLPPISTMGLGRTEVSSLRRVPNPPAKIIAFIRIPYIYPQKMAAPVMGIKLTLYLQFAMFQFEREYFISLHGGIDIVFEF